MDGNMTIIATDIIEKGELTDYHGKILKPRGLTSTLKTLGFGKGIAKKIDGVTKKLIPLESVDLPSLFKKYGYQVTNETVLSPTLENKEEEVLEQQGGHSNNGDNRNSVTDVIQTQAGKFRKVLARTYQKCANCGDVTVKGLQYQNVIDDKLWCDICAYIF